MSTDTQLRWVDGTRYSESGKPLKSNAYCVVLHRNKWWASRMTCTKWEKGPFPTREAAKEACERHHQGSAKEGLAQDVGG